MISRNKFIRKYCYKCKLCDNIAITREPSFCYDFIYLKKPSKFINNCFPKLIKYTQDDIMEACDDDSVIKYVFCSSKICHGKNKKRKCSDKQLDDCTSMLVEQLLQIESIFKTSIKKEKESALTFLFGGTEEWKILVKTIMEETNEDTDKQQDGASQS